MSTVNLVLLCAAGLLLSLLLAAVIRTCLIKAKPNKRKSMIEYSAGEEAGYARTLSEMVKIPTVSLRKKHDLTQFERLQNVLEAQFPLIHEKLEKTVLDGNLLFRWKGRSSDDAVLLMGHQDVVTAEETTWRKDPFSGAIEDGKVWGRGAMDCKCTVMTEFQAVEELLRESFVPEFDIYLASSVDEEISGGGAQKTVKYLADNGVRLSVVIDEGGGISEGVLPGLEGFFAVIGVVEKGYMDVRIKAKGRGGHSSTPPKHTPIARLSDFVSEFERKRPFKKKLTRPVKEMFAGMAPYLGFGMRLLLGNIWLFGPLLTLLLPLFSSYGESLVATTFAFTMCQGGSTPNVIPDEAYVICNLRPALHQGFEESADVLRKHAAKHDLEVEVIEGRDASNEAPTNAYEYKYLKECVNDCFPEIGVSSYYIGGGTDCRNYELVCDNCLRFCPIKMDTQQLRAMHAANENIDTFALAESVKFYKYYLTNRKADNKF